VRLFTVGILTMTGLLVILWTLSTFWHAWCLSEHGLISVVGGGIHLAVYEGTSADRRQFVAGSGRGRIGPVAGLHCERAFRPERWTSLATGLNEAGAWLPSWHRVRWWPANPGPGGPETRVTQTTADIPMWVPVSALLALLAITRLIRRRRRTPLCCSKCGYNLTGNISGRCPECGCATKSLGKEDCEVGP
jgi:hypothetical protein